MLEKASQTVDKENNRMLSSIELSEFLMYNVSEILKYYEEFKEEQSYEYERNSKGNMAK